MALPTSNIRLVNVASVLSGGFYSTPLKMSDWFNSSLVNKYGLNETYCSGSTPTLRLSNLLTTPYSLGKFRGYDHTATPISTFDAAVFIDVGTLTREQDINGTITVYKTSDDTQVGLIAQVNAITTNTQYYFNNIPEEYYIVWNLTKRTNGTPISTSISWTENLTSTIWFGQNSGNWNADTDFSVLIT